MLNWYRSLIPGRMPLPLAWFVALFGMAALLLWIAATFGGGIVIPLRAGDTIRFEQVRQGAETTEAHHFTVEALGIDINLNDGRFEDDPSACAADADAPDGAADADAPDGTADADAPGGAADAEPPGGPVDLYEITFPEPGQFLISDCAHPNAHGLARFAVEASDGGGGRLIVTGAFVVEDGGFVLSIPQTEAQFGYAPGTSVPSRAPADQLIFVSLIGGSVLAAPVIAWARRRRWWLWAIFGVVGGFLGGGQPFLTSATVAAAALLGERPRPAPPDEDEDEEEPAEREDEGPPGPPTQDQRTLPPPPPSAAGTPPRARPQRPRRRPRF